MAAQGSKKVIIAALAGDSLTAVTKFVAAGSKPWSRSALILRTGCSP